MLNKIWKTCLLVFLVLLPFQTRWIYLPAFLNGGFWEYGSFSWYGTEIILWVAIFAFFFERFFHGGRFKHLFGSIHLETHKKNLTFAVMFVLIFAFEILHGESPALSYDFVFHVLEGISLFILMVFYIEKRDLLMAFWTGGIVQALLGSYQFFTQEIGANKWLGLAYQAPSQLGSFVVESGTERWLRAYGAFGSPNILGGYLALTFIVGLLLYLSSKPVHKIFLTPGQAIILIGLTLSFSRGAWLAAAAGWVAIGAILLFRLIKKQGSFFWRFHRAGMYGKQSIFYAIVIVALGSLFGSLFSVRFDPSNRLENRSLTERATQYLEAEAVINNNFFFGVGPGAYTLNAYRQNPTLPAYAYQPPHNVFVLLLAEWGMIGGLIWFAIFAFLLALVYRQNPEYLVIVIVLFTAAVFDHYWWSLYVGLMMWWATFGLLFNPGGEEMI